MPVSLKKLYKSFPYFLWYCWKARGITTHRLCLGKLRHEAILVIFRKSHKEAVVQPSVLAISKSFFSSSQKYHGNRRKKSSMYKD